jgi:hypothetical protein
MYDEVMINDEDYIEDIERRRVMRLLFGGVLGGVAVCSGAEMVARLIGAESGKDIPIIPVGELADFLDVKRMADIEQVWPIVTKSLINFDRLPNDLDKVEVDLIGDYNSKFNIRVVAIEMDYKRMNGWWRTIQSPYALFLDKNKALNTLVSYNRFDEIDVYKNWKNLNSVGLSELPDKFKGIINERKLNGPVVVSASRRVWVPGNLRLVNNTEFPTGISQAIGMHDAVTVGVGENWTTMGFTQKRFLLDGYWSETEEGEVWNVSRQGKEYYDTGMKYDEWMSIRQEFNGLWERLR